MPDYINLDGGIFSEPHPPGKDTKAANDDDKPAGTEPERLEDAKKLMNWDEEREPTLLEYLRYYRSGEIGEIHIEAAIKAAQSQLLTELMDEENITYGGMSSDIPCVPLSVLKRYAAKPLN